MIVGLDVAVLQEKKRPLVNDNQQPQKKRYDARSSGLMTEAILFEPYSLGVKGLAANLEGPQHRPINRSQVRPPTTFTIGLDMACSRNLQSAERSKVDEFVVDAANLAAGVNGQRHQALHT
jgi:hypothetical protein